MIAQIKEYKNEYLYCSNCRMRIQSLREPHCDYCGSTLANWEEMAVKYWNLVVEDEIKNGIKQ